MNESALFNTFARAPLAFERGEGVWLVAGDGERYLDFAGGIAVNSLGHSHPHLVAALTEQAGKLWHVSNLYEIPDQDRLAERLAAETFADRVFFTNSGAEALECAIKTARRWQFAKGHPERFRIITFEGAFHGRTLATIAAGGQPKYLEGFGPKVEGFDQVPFFDLDAVKKAIGPETAAILIEPLQGEGGIRELPAGGLAALRRLCDEHGLLLILDEVQSGIGRTGRLFAYQWTDVEPDIMAIAKGIGGGFPLGACLATEKAARGMTFGTHGSTYGGNPLAMAAGMAVLDAVANEEFLASVREKGERLRIRTRLEQFIGNYPDLFESVRGKGLMLGIRMKSEPRPFMVHLRDNHQLLTVAAGDQTLRLLPPLVIGDAEIEEFFDKLSAAAASYQPEE